MSKAGLAPIRTVLIPRLELTAAVISTRLEHICHHLNLTLIDPLYWTDNMIVLHYLRNEEQRFQTFVANRVAMIRNVSSPTQWRHVPSEANPVDDVSRSLTTRNLVERICGPHFLWESEALWPRQPDFDSYIPENEEVKKEPQAYHVISEAEDIVNSLLRSSPTGIN